MDLKTQHWIIEISGVGTQTRVQKSRSLFWINQIASKGIQEFIVIDDDFMEHITSLDIGVCIVCEFPTQDNMPICKDCDAIEESIWRDYQEEIGNAHMVSVGVA